MDKKEQIKNILLNTNINFLLGAGTSYKDGVANCFPLMGHLADYVKKDSVITTFYSSLKSDELSKTIKNIYDTQLYIEKPNIENFLSSLEAFIPYVIDKTLKCEVINQADTVKSLITERIKSSDKATCLDNYKNFYKSLKKIIEYNSIKNQTLNVFTTNYDMMNEIAMESLNIHYYCGFFGSVNRRFSPSLYNYAYVDKFDYKKSNINVLTNHINLYKLHGSLSWYLDDEGNLIEKNPFDCDFIPEIIYPSAQKYNSTNVIISFSTLLREFANNICKDNTSLFVSGTSLSDEHINKIIDNALSINTFHLILFCIDDKQIYEMKARFSDYTNVIVFDEKTLFSDIASLVNDVLK